MAKKNKSVASMDSVEDTVMAPVEEVVESVEEEVMPFDSWYALRSSVIPAVHKKEILRADFRGRKVSMESTMAEFDEALKKYGVKLV